MDATVEEVEELILVTGAAGKTGRAVIAALAGRRIPVRAMVHRSAQSETVKNAGAEDVLAGDMRDAAAWNQAMQGVKGVYFICPNVLPDELLMAEKAMETARKAGVERFVYHSVLHPQTQEMPHHWQKLRVEEQLFASGLNYTIIQPGAYMQNILAYWDHIVNEGVYRIPYSVKARISMIDLCDVAAAAAEVLRSSGHENAIYELAGPEAITQVEVVNVISRYVGRAVRVEEIPLKDWTKQARKAKIEGYPLDTLLSMFRYYDRHGLCGNSNVYGWLMGRPATSFADFIERTVRQQHEK